MEFENEKRSDFEITISLRYPTGEVVENIFDFEKEHVALKMAISASNICRAAICEERGRVKGCPKLKEILANMDDFS